MRIQPMTFQILLGCSNYHRVVAPHMANRSQVLG